MTSAPDSHERVPRAIEVGFPIAEINRLAQPERNSFKPIYQMHKWFARRASCVFRAILLGALKPAWDADGEPVDLMEEFYRNHSDDPDTAGKVVLDPFMGGGTTVVEALRLGCRVIGIDLNPVAWFIVKTEVEPVDLDALRDAFERLAARPVTWNRGAPLRETLLGLYRTQVTQELTADVIYTFWVKHAICTVPTCKREVPLFKDWFIAQKTVSVRYHRDVTCPKCGKLFDWEIEPVSLMADTRMMVSSPRGSAGIGRPHQKWSYAPEPARPKGRGRKDTVHTSVHCPRCREDVAVQVPWDRKKQRKKVSLTVLLCPACEAVWQWRGPVPDDAVDCPACHHRYDPQIGNVPAKATFQCPCGNRDKIIESIRLLPKNRRLPVRPYAIQAWLDPTTSTQEQSAEKSLFGDHGGAVGVGSEPTRQRVPPPDHFLLPKNGKFFKRFSVSDQAALRRAEKLWTDNKAKLPYPKSKIPVGEKTKSGLLAHHYNHWHEMFAPRQLLALTTLLDGIMAEKDAKLQEMLLCAFSGLLDLNNLFTRYMVSRSSAGGQTAQGVFARHDFQPKVTIAENNVFGLPEIAMGSFCSRYHLLLEGIAYRASCWDFREDGQGRQRQKTATDSLRATEQRLFCDDSTRTDFQAGAAVITDPPYLGNVNYAELSDFYYVWQRLLLKDRYPCFAPEFTPKVEEVIENRVRNKSRDDFYAGLTRIFSHLYAKLADAQLLVFTFHHTDTEGKVWEGLLQSLCDADFEIVAVYPIHAESETSLHIRDNESVAYDLIHVCRKRRENPSDRSWAGVRQEVRRRARAELAAIETGRYGKRPLPEPDVRLVCIGKCLELYSAHYNRVLDHEGNPLPLHKALQDIGAIVDQLVTRERALPPELEDIDALSYAWIRLLMPARREVSIDRLNKGLRAMQVTTEDLRRAGLLIRGRVGRGRTYQVKQPVERVEMAAKRLLKTYERAAQNVLFQDDQSFNSAPVALVDLLHVLIALAEAGQPVLPWVERFPNRRAALRAGLRFLRDERVDWAAAIDRVLAVIEGAPLLNRAGVA